ncbi:SIR2 family transcriptional regulator (macronuclear) [Tetrahymena thermophila SB210]|uniref:SIR2 family transcriptional regulator n=1 Tax=Tetrahymena thermophila (strain SB210) TaxID=312017 RepID=Q23RH0_TETTS|nr:SIR2 family transcriptional regulator [Tetrahymena thermophila SB210]EAR99078.2 SIR2 family transcriptional regulator [Tetrahymena thermophila SB210]|eukprot:XP_001019323.2 SIR2 family transcriptional regulator [Tetrahymena thermophila SB210]
MSQKDIQTEQIETEQSQLLHSKDIQIDAQNKEQESTSHSENQQSTEDSNSSKEIYIGNEKNQIREDEDIINTNCQNEVLSSDKKAEINTDQIQKEENTNQSKEDIQSEQKEDNKNTDTTQQNQKSQVEIKSTQQIIQESRELDQKVQDMIKQTQSSIQQTLDSTSRTLKSVEQTMKEINETNKRFDQFNEAYQSTMQQFGQKLQDAFGQGHLESEYDFMPQISDVEEIAQILKLKTEAVFLIGKENLNSEFKSNLQKREYFQNQSEEYWKTYGIVKENLSLSGSNEVDNSLVQIANSLYSVSTNCTLITTSIEDGLRAALFQNINRENLDDNSKSNQIGCLNQFEQQQNQSTQQKEEEEEINLDKNTRQMTNYEVVKSVYYEDEEYKSTFKEMDNFEKQGVQYDFDLFSGKYNYFQIHGNINFIRCSSNQCKNKNKSEFLNSYGPIYDLKSCPECQCPMRPHIKFDDEETDENIYNVDWIKSKVNQLDCLILVGLNEDEKNEPFYKELIQKSIEYGILIIEISIQPQLEIGHIKQLIGYPQEMIILLRDQLLYS